MMRKSLSAVLGALALTSCGDMGEQAQRNQPVIQVRSTEQQQLHQLDAMNLAIGLKRAIYDAGFTCRRITDAGFVGNYKNLEMWVAHCTYDRGAARDWAVFAGPDGSAQVRDCKDLPGTGLPSCEIKKRPKGEFGTAS